MIIFGTRGSQIDGEFIENVECPHCQKTGMGSYGVVRYFHVYWIPMIAASPNVGMVCPHCKFVWEDKSMEPDMRRDLKRLVVSKKRMILYNFGAVAMASVFAYSFLAAAVNDVSTAVRSDKAPPVSVELEEVPQWKKMKTWDSGFANELITEAGREWKISARELENGDRKTAIARYLSGRSPLDKYVETFGGRNLESGESLSEAYLRMRGELEPAVFRSFNELVLEAANSSGSVQAFHEFAKGFDDFLSRDSYAEYNKAFDQIDAERAKRAVKKVRVLLDARGFDKGQDELIYRAFLIDRLAHAWSPSTRSATRRIGQPPKAGFENAIADPSSGFELVFEKPFGPKEEAATWRTYRLGYSEIYTAYSNEDDHGKSKVVTRKLPSGFVAFLENAGSACDDCDTTWDALPVAEVEIDMPDEIMRVGHQSSLVYRRQIQAELLKSVSIPRFDILPSNFSSLSQVFEPTGEINRERLRRFAFRDRAAFESKSKEWLLDTNIPNRFEVILVWVEFDFGECLKEYATILPRLDSDYRGRVASALEKRPDLVAQLSSNRAL